ncbi:cytochrome b [Kangiella sp. HZ709]|uniref:cytochrome b n=1 Tax=Kangiella sp. HZ709 TaxID=2666328 RepID=UPI0018A1F65D|nr:cytochrome b [Kangiella sp. HZ709]
MQKYTLTMRLLHWFMAILILGLIATGWYMEGIPRDAPNKYDLYSWHKSFGLTLFLLVLVRFIVRITSKRPSLSEKMPSWEKQLSRAGHFFLYLLMFFVPLSGIIMSDAGGHPLNFFFTSFDILVTDKKLASIGADFHAILPYVLLGIVVLHLFGVLKHKFIDKDPELDVLKKML